MGCGGGLSSKEASSSAKTREKLLLAEVGKGLRKSKRKRKGKKREKIELIHVLLLADKHILHMFIITQPFF